MATQPEVIFDVVKYEDSPDGLYLWIDLLTRRGGKCKYQMRFNKETKVLEVKQRNGAWEVVEG